MKPKILIILAGILLLQCSSNDPLHPNGSELPLIAETMIGIAEPSGLSLGRHNQTLWVVNDAPNSNIFEISLRGAILQKLNFQGDDLEGVVYDSLENVLWVAEERKREIVQVAMDGTKISSHAIMINGNDTNGLEGISINSQGRLWTVNEKEPGLLVSLLADFSIDYQIELLYAKDYSGLSSGPNDNQVWLISDENQLLMKFDKNTGILKSYVIPVEKAEGVAVDEGNGRIYIVSESQSILYTFELID